MARYSDGLDVANASKVKLLPHLVKQQMCWMRWQSADVPCKVLQKCRLAKGLTSECGVEKKN